MRLDMKVVLFWWTLVSVSTVLTGTVLFYGGLPYILKYDQTYLTLSITGLYFLTTAYIGWSVYRNNEIAYGKCWSVSSTLTSLGLLGTVAGILLMVNGAFVANGTITMNNIGALQASILQGMGTATMTTIAGLIYSMFLSWQLIILQQE